MNQNIDKVSSSELHAVTGSSLEQPFSLLTVKSNLINKNNNDDNLLTIRCLEFSEKKMQLLKDLLSPDEFESSMEASKWLQDERFDLEPATDVESIKEDLDHKISRSIPAYLDDNHISNQQHELGKSHKLKSKSEANLRFSKQHQNQAQRIEAINFFHGQGSSIEFNSQKGNQLEIASRNAVPFEQIDILNNQLITENDADSSLVGTIVGIIRSIFGFNGTNNRETDLSSDEEAKFVNYYQTIHIGGYATKSNLRLMWKRLFNSGQTSKLKTPNLPKTQDEFVLVRIRKNPDYLNRQEKRGSVPKSQVDAISKLKSDEEMIIEKDIKDIWIYDMFKRTFSIGDKHKENGIEISIAEHNSNLNQHEDNLNKLIVRFTSICLEKHPLMNSDIEADRGNLESWLNSLSVRLWFNDKIYEDYNPSDLFLIAEYLQETNGNNLHLDVAEQRQEINIIMPNTDQDYNAGLKFELFEPKLRVFSSWSKRLIGYGCLKLQIIKPGGSVSQTLALNVDDAEIQFKIELSYRIDKPVISTNKIPKLARFGLEINTKIDGLYEKLFNVELKANPEIKLAKIINRIDPNCITQLLNPDLESTRILRIDPLVDWIVRDFQLNLRQKLLQWRFSHNLNQPVHLSKAENIKRYGLNVGYEQSEKDLEPEKIAKLFLELQINDHRLIEQRRLRAIKFIQQYELELCNTMKFNSAKLSQPLRAFHQLVREPRLGKPDLAKIARLATLMMPRIQAVRPLMAGNTHRMRLRSSPLSRKSSTLMNNQQSIWTTDLEAFVAGNSSEPVINQNIINNLQLVITIQQASNVPMRIQQMPAVHDSTMINRSSSPFLGAPGSPASSLFGRSPTGDVSPINMAQQHPIARLVPPTTYVEIIFQRKHQATSLTTGRDPIWNETLFFPVIDQETQSSPSRIVDEFIQLNLYDHHSYYLDNNSSEDLDDPTLKIPGYSDFSTLNMTSRLNYDNINGKLSLASERQGIIPMDKPISAAHQKIERHLLGHLRIPLSTLIKNDKIEGSFALNQPIFLDNYQFLADLNVQSPQQAAETRLGVFISLDPHISSQGYYHLPVGTHEEQHIYEYARIWEQVLSQYKFNLNDKTKSNSTPFNRVNRKSNKNRTIHALVLYKDCKYVLMNRLLGPMEFPISLYHENDLTKTMFSLTRFVSLLMPIKEGFFNMRQLDSIVCFDSLQLLEQNLGGSEEKAILLCNYFLQLGKCSAILQGDAIPDGPCNYVIVWEHQDQATSMINLLEEQMIGPNESIQQSYDNNSNNNNNLLQQVSMGVDTTPVDHTNFTYRLPILMNPRYIRIWDPKSARFFSLNEYLPLININSIVTPENIYANIQSNDIITDTNFDIRLKSNWFPLFGTSSHNQSRSLASSISGSRNLNELSLSNHDQSTRRRLLRRTQSKWRRQLTYVESLGHSIGRPVLDPIISPISSLRPNYDTFGEEHCTQLRSFLEKAIKTNILKWRHNRPTYFNRTLSRKLTSELAQMEDHLISSSSQINNPQQTPPNSQIIDWRTELADVIRNATLVPRVKSGGGYVGVNSSFGSRKVVSWPINISYTCLKPILNSLYGSDIHNADLILDSHYNSQEYDRNSASSNTQFLVSSYVHVYPANIMSVWLYVAALVPITAKQQRSLIY